MFSTPLKNCKIYKEPEVKVPEYKIPVIKPSKLPEGFKRGALVQYKEKPKQIGYIVQVKNDIVWAYFQGIGEWKINPKEVKII